MLTITPNLVLRSPTGTRLGYPINGVLADLVPRGYGPPGPIPLADLVPLGPYPLADLVPQADQIC